MSEHEQKTIEAIAREIFTEFKNAGHICVSGERFAVLETKLDTIISNQDEFKTTLENMKKSKDEDVKKIEKHDTFFIILGAAILFSWGVFTWWFAEYKESNLNKVRAEHAEWHKDGKANEKTNIYRIR